MSKIKHIISSPLLIIRFFKKSKIDNFVGGVIFGSIFSLFVNVITIQVQESIQRQRIFEALENEIVSNALTANTFLENSTKIISKNELPNYFTVYEKFSDNVWRSNEAIKYISQLDPKTQGLIMTYYRFSIRQVNETNDKFDNFIGEKLKNCYGFEKISLNDEANCRKTYHDYLSARASFIGDTGTKSFELLKEFHPTQDRLHDPFLSLLMGSKSIRILSGK